MDTEKRPLSASQLTTWLGCGRKYAFRYVHRVTPEHRPAAMALGRAVHSALEELHLRRLDGEPVDDLNLVRTFRADFQAEVDTGLSFKSDESANMLRWYGETLIVEYVKWLGDQKVVAAEQPFEIDLVDPETGEIHDERLRGYFDLILAGDIVGEVKTIARRYDEGTLARKIQLSAYAYAWRQMKKRDPTIVVVELLKQRRPEVATAVASRTVEDDAFFVHLALEVAHAIDSGSFPPNPGWMCGDCEYAKACRSFRGDRGFVPEAHVRGGEPVHLSEIVPRVLADAQAAASR